MLLHFYGDHGDHGYIDKAASRSTKRVGGRNDNKN